MSMVQGVADIASQAGWPAAVTDLVARVETSARAADQGVIEAAKVLLELSRVVSENGIADDSSWYGWARQNIRVKQSRLRELMQIAKAPDPEHEAERLALMRARRQANYRAKNRPLCQLEPERRELIDLARSMPIDDVRQAIRVLDRLRGVPRPLCADTPAGPDAVGAHG